MSTRNCEYRTYSVLSIHPLCIWPLFNLDNPCTWFGTLWLLTLSLSLNYVYRFLLQIRCSILSDCMTQNLSTLPSGPRQSQCFKVLNPDARRNSRLEKWELRECFQQCLEPLSSSIRVWRSFFCFISILWGWSCSAWRRFLRHPLCFSRLGGNKWRWTCFFCPSHA